MNSLHVADISTVDRTDEAESEGVDAGPRLRLSIVHGPRPLADDGQVVLDAQSGELLIGRSVHGGWSLGDSRLSRVHCRVRWDAGQQAFRITDAESSNGTYMNGSKVTSSALNQGDVIRCGDTVLVASTESAAVDPVAEVRRLASTNMAVLVEGETGVGKEVLARLIHEQSGVPGPLVAVNCATLSRELAAAELFGHVRGAFSGAAQARLGLCASAHGGSLFLDEIGDLPADVQPTLLRALEEGAVRPVGSDQLRPIDVRFIAATNLDLDTASVQGKFRADLLARLAQWRVRIPPLRDRRAEVLPLARAFAAEQGFELTLSANAAEALVLWSYPFNIRELKTLVRKLAATPNAKHKVDLKALRLVDRRLTGHGSFLSDHEPVESEATIRSRRTQLQSLLKEHDGNVSRVARSLNCDRAQVYRWLRSYGMSPSGFRR